MIDVFVRVWAETDLRLYLAAAVIERLRMLADADVHVVLHKYSIALPGWHRSAYAILDADDFARRSRECCETDVVGQHYVLIDDDQMPIGKDWLERGIATLSAHPEYEMLSSWSVNGEVAPTGDGEIFDVESAGTPCFVRKGTFMDLPVGSAMQYDNVLSAHLQRNGGRLGFLRDVRHNHLGYGLSQVVPAHWRA